jgi:hypothetical protein
LDPGLLPILEASGSNVDGVDSTGQRRDSEIAAIVAGCLVGYVRGLVGGRNFCTDDDRPRLIDDDACEPTAELSQPARHSQKHDDQRESNRKSC